MRRPTLEDREWVQKAKRVSTSLLHSNGHDANVYLQEVREKIQTEEIGLRDMIHFDNEDSVYLKLSNKREASKT